LVQNWEPRKREQHHFVYGLLCIDITITKVTHFKADELCKRTDTSETLRLKKAPVSIHHHQTP
ncbi:hypothetical protein LMH73_018060, partial [Vibrio splendidus]